MNIKKKLKSLKVKMMNENQRSDYLIELLRERGASIGENVDILNSSVDTGEAYLITIGNNVTITNASILTHDASTKKALGYTKTGEVRIGSDVFIGMGAIVLPDTRIGSKVIIGAGTVVAKNIPDNSVAVGNPCRVICSYDEYIEKNKKAMETYPCFDCLPMEMNTEQKELLTEKGKGFIR